MEPCASTLQSGTFMWNLVEPELLRMEPLCGTLWNLNFLEWNRGTFMQNPAEPGARFRAAAPNHPGALLEEPQAYQAVGEKFDRSTASYFMSPA